MSQNYIWFDGKRVMAGAADVKTSGKSFTDAFTKLDGAGSPITAIEAEHPGGDDEAGREFAGWYTEGKKQIVSMGKEIGDVIASWARTRSWHSHSS